MKLAAWMSLMLVLSLFVFTRMAETATKKEKAFKNPWSMATGLTLLLLSGFTLLIWTMVHPIA